MLGSRSVGKSSLTVQYVEGQFAESYYPTIENTFNKVIKFKGASLYNDIALDADSFRPRICY